MPKTKRNLNDFIVPLNMNGLQGRMLNLPAPRGKTRNILLVYGLHASLERHYGLAEVLNAYGGVTVPDLPGYGGMDSFYKIGEKPSLDTMADYLATFIKLRYRRQAVTIIGLTSGFAIVTRMLQRYPELRRKVNLLISIKGFARSDDIRLSSTKRWLYRVAGRVFIRRLPALIFRNMILHPSIIKRYYSHKFTKGQYPRIFSAEDKLAAVAFETYLWRKNDVRTFMQMSLELLDLDNCHKKLNMPIVQVLGNDGFLDERLLEQHMQVIYSGYYVARMRKTGRPVTVIASKGEAGVLVPPFVRKLLTERV